VAITAFICSVFFALSAWPGLSGILSFAAISVAVGSVAAAYSTFWALPTTILSGTAASAGIAWINSVGNLAGYFSPFLVGKIREATHEMFWALLMLAFCCLISAILTIVCLPAPDRRSASRSV
jgi:nitrate/nitrite transporter NarK